MASIPSDRTDEFDLSVRYFVPPLLALPGYAIAVITHEPGRWMDHRRRLPQMNALLVTGALVVAALLVRALLILVYANSSAYNVQRRLRQFAKR